MFDDPDIDNIGEQTSTPGEKMFMFICVEYRSMSSVVSLGVPVLVTLSVTTQRNPGSIASIPGAVVFVLPGITSVLHVRFYVGSSIYVLK